MSLFTGVDDIYALQGKLASVEGFSAIVNALNYLLDSMPVGTVVPILTGLSLGQPTPDPTLWLKIDGQKVTDPNSPLYNQTLADLTATITLIQAASSLGVAGDTGGTNTINLNHNHGGTAASPDLTDTGAHGTTEYTPLVNHVHLLSDDLGVTSIEPATFLVNFYLKVK